MNDRRQERHDIPVREGMERRVHIQRMSDGQWIGVSEGSGAVMLCSSSRDEALEELGRTDDGERDITVIVHGANGEVLEQRSYLHAAGPVDPHNWD